MIRKSAVAGYFYPGRAEELRRMLKMMVDPKSRKEKALAVVSPHAGYIYSGPVAGAVFSSVSLPDLLVLLGPSHRGMRSIFAIMAEGAWQTPLGDVPLDPGLAAAISKRSALIKVDASAHAQEHSIEVQLPFVQYLRPDFSIVPVCISPLADFQGLAELGRAIAAAIKESGREVLVVASTDMSHYVSREAASRKDHLAIEKILALDAEGLFEVVQENDISMCGFQPTAAAIVAAKEMGAGKAELIRYATSGDATGNYDEIVAYAGLRII